MTAEGQTLNTDIPDASTGESSPPGESSDGLVATVELAEKAAATVADTDPEGAKKTEGAEDGTKVKAEAKKEEAKTKEEAKAEQEAKDKAEAEEAKTKEKADSERFDKHPRFKELTTANRELRERLAKADGRIDELAKQITAKGTKEPDYKDITGMSAEELNEWRDDDPKAFYANLARQARAEVREELLDEMKEERATSQAKTLEEKQVETYEKYAEKNPDFDEMWDSGAIEKFMRANPGHNAISAHMSLTAEKRTGDTKKDIDAAVTKAIKETEEKILKNIKAKGAASVLGAGPSTAPGPSEALPDEMKNSKKYGGKTAVLVSRLKARRAAKEAQV